MAACSRFRSCPSAASSSSVASSFCLSVAALLCLDFWLFFLCFFPLLCSLVLFQTQWGYRRCEDICWLKTNKKAAQKRRLQGASHVNEVLSYMSSHLNHDETSALQRTTEHCLMGIKGLVRRSQVSLRKARQSADTRVVCASFARLFPPSLPPSLLPPPLATSLALPLIFTSFSDSVFYVFVSNSARLSFVFNAVSDDRRAR